MPEKKEAVGNEERRERVAAWMKDRADKSEERMNQF